MRCNLPTHILTSALQTNIHQKYIQLRFRDVQLVLLFYFIAMNVIISIVRNSRYNNTSQQSYKKSLSYYEIDETFFFFLFPSAIIFGGNRKKRKRTQSILCILHCLYLTIITFPNSSFLPSFLLFLFESILPSPNNHTNLNELSSSITYMFDLSTTMRMFLLISYYVCLVSCIVITTTYL